MSPRPSSPHPILNLGFRIFFVGAGVFAVLSMLLWLLILQGIAPFRSSLSAFYWHGHQMVFGYGLAVVAGFLLTAVKTWTGQQMPYGKKLLGIFICWALARLCHLGAHAMPATTMLCLGFLFDMLFWGLTTYFVVRAVWVVRQRRQLGIVINLVIMWLVQIVFFVGVLSQNLILQKQALYLGFYLIIALVLTIGRRVLPFFIEKGVQVDDDGKPNTVSYEQKNSQILDYLSLVGLFGFVVMMLLQNTVLTACFALLVALVNAWRLINWYHKGIWQKVLLWSLYGSFWGVVIGFGMLALVPIVQVVNLPSLALHTLALSAIGVTTLSMMCRVALGHTGRNIHQPPKGIAIIFLLMVFSLVCRVFLPMLSFDDYKLWLLLSQLCWLLAFGLFLFLYVRILASPRVDGLFG